MHGKHVGLARAARVMDSVVATDMRRVRERTLEGHHGTIGERRGKLYGVAVAMTGDVAVQTSAFLVSAADVAIGILVEAHCEAGGVAAIGPRSAPVADHAIGEQHVPPADGTAHRVQQP